MVKMQDVNGWVEGRPMTWDWNSPIALGLFILMCGGAVVLVGIGIAFMTTGAARVTAASAAKADRRR